MVRKISMPLMAVGALHLLVSSPAQAQEAHPLADVTANLTTEPRNLNHQQRFFSGSPDVAPTFTTDGLAQFSPQLTTNPMGQVTGVNQLRDMAPRDWAYQALSDLISRYNCVAGYPDRTFQGNRPLSRYEFAAGLNACLQVMERVIAETDGVPAETLGVMQQLMAEFETELANLGQRVDGLESRVAFLEDNQFSTTT